MATTASISDKPDPAMDSIIVSAKATVAVRLNGLLLIVLETSTLWKEKSMPSETTYTSLRENLASVLDEVVDQQETVIVRRRGARDVALISASELAGLLETAHLLRSPRNAKRLLSALRRSTTGSVKPRSAKDLPKEMQGEATE